MPGSYDETLRDTLTWGEPDGSEFFDLDLDATGAGRDRYTLLARIGHGGMGEVLRVHDRRLDAICAMKVLGGRLSGSDQARDRFLHEVRITSQLRHPGIVAVHDRGELDDGRPWFTMTEVRGRTLKVVIDEAHKTGPSALRGLIDVIRRAAEAVAYAHEHGVIHRDLKPANVMVGEFGEVFVMDWGLARKLEGGRELVPEGLSEAERTLSTRYGAVMGTPAYMPPEQANGDPDELGPPVDVYALGSVLYIALAGSPPFAGDSVDILGELLNGPPRPLSERARPDFPIPAELQAICERAMARQPSDRYPTASGLVRALIDWLDGAARREEADLAVARANSMRPEIDALLERADQLQADADGILQQVKPNDPVARKRTAWMLLDQAEELRTQAAFQEGVWLQTVRSALTRVADHGPAHRILGQFYKERLVEAEARGARAEAVRLETQLRGHDLGEHSAFLDGRAWLTLHTDPPGATASLYRWVTRDRRRELQFVRELGPTPLRELPVRNGSYVVRLEHRDRATVDYPFTVGRLEHWNPMRPGADVPHPVVLPASDAFTDNEVYVPAGWFRVGGDLDAIDTLPSARVWVDAFAIQRTPVTYGDYLAFLDDLARLQGVEQALEAAPRPQDRDSGAAPLVEYRDGSFRLTASPEGPQLRPEWPVERVSWREARAYATWWSARTGQPWDLPSELAWEKAARGTDARPFPWGEHFDATWANMSEHYEMPRRAPTSEHPFDRSPYGVLGLAGGVRDWCLEVWRSDGPPVVNGILQVSVPAPDDSEFRAVRGGSWVTVRGGVRSAARFAGLPDKRFGGNGFRLARWLPW